MTDKTQPEALRALAEAAKWTGKWYDAGCNTVYCTYDKEDSILHDEIAHPVPFGVSGYIAAAHPQAVIALLDRIAELESELEAVGVGGVQALSAAPAGAAPKEPPVCPDCNGTGVDGDVGNDGRVVDCVCGGCAGSGKARFLGKCPDGMRCLHGCLVDEQCHLDRRAMLAASPTPPAEQQATKETSGGFHVWRDISTAPKDGSHFVATGYNYGLYSEGRHICVAQWFRGCWMETSDWNEASELQHLTHWLPLPSPPDDVAAPAEQQAAPQAVPAAVGHDEDLLEKLYWEFDSQRKKTGEDRLAFKVKMRFYASEFLRRSDGKMTFAQSVSDDMMNLADRLGSEFDDVDPRAWKHLLVYAPKAAPGEPVAWRISDPNEPDLGFWLAEEDGGEGFLSEPLYTRTAPQAAGQDARPCHVFTVRKAGGLTEWEPTTMALALPDGAHALYTLPQPSPHAQADSVTAPAVASEPIAYLYDDGSWTPAKTEEGHKLNDWMISAGSPKIGVHLASTAQPTPLTTLAQATQVGNQQEAREPSHRETVDVVGVRSNGEHVNLEKIAMPPRMKAREIAIEQFGSFKDDDGSDAEMCFGALEYFLEWLIQQGWSKAPQQAPAPLSDAQIKELIEDGVFLGNCKEIVRAIEHAHGITQKGGSNAE